MTTLLENMVEELFQKQFKYRNGRYSIQSPIAEPQRLQWIGSPHCAIIFQNMRRSFGNRYIVEDYCAGKIYGHMFCSAISQFTSISKFVVPMLSLVVKRFGWGKINPVITNYARNEYQYEFEDAPVAREVYKMYGKQDIPVDSMIAGLVGGSMEEILRKRFIALETSCLAQGKDRCTFVVVEPKAANSLLSKMKGEQLELAKEIVEAERERDFAKEAAKLLKGQNKAAVAAERAYLKS